ncbi:hypothetical protein [Actinopolymorpha alba]|uniref:hypothetical protein n=1 Tax=Actinopolymorpha alba TaxID=533267 RepID=UPI000367731B|nr:hypothetical protein [Actinopolymorpha alba]
MGNGQKAAVLGLAVLVVLFGLVVANQRRMAGNTSGPDVDKVQRLVERAFDRWVDDPATVDRSQLDADCFAAERPDRLVVRGSCTLWVAASDTRIRMVRLHIHNAITVSSRAPQSDVVVDDEIGADKDVSIAVDGKRESIALVCGFGKTCLITLSGRS